jgi:hypothetical protein
MKRFALFCFVVVFLLTPAAHAGMFSGFGSLFTAIYDSLVEDVVGPLTIAAVAWTLLASFFRLGGAVAALVIALVGVGICQADVIWEAVKTHVLH